MYKCFGDGKELNTKWQTFKIIGGSLLRCLSKDVIPVSIRLKSNIKTQKGCHIIKKALLNERIRSINNTINMLSHQRDTCKIDLKRRLEEQTMEECFNFIKTWREARHFKTMERQKRKVERLFQKKVLVRMATQTSSMVTIQ